MAKFKFELDKAGVAQLLKSPEMQSLLGGMGVQRASMAGDGYASDVHVFQKRAVAHIYADTPEAKRDNYDNNTLLKVLK